MKIVLALRHELYSSTPGKPRPSALVGEHGGIIDLVAAQIRIPTKVRRSGPLAFEDQSHRVDAVVGHPAQATCCRWVRAYHGSVRITSLDSSLGNFRHRCGGAGTFSAEHSFDQPIAHAAPDSSAAPRKLCVQEHGHGQQSAASVLTGVVPPNPLARWNHPERSATGAIVPAQTGFNERL